MHIVSTGTSTVLSDFEGLVKKYTYPHPHNESRDFQFYTSNSVFVAVNRKSNLELMRVRERATELQRVLKLKVDGLYCVACTKKSNDEMALGLINGQMRMYNYKTSKFSRAYKSDNGSAVLFADFNSTDDYVVSIFESGAASLYGTQTNTKFESLNLNMNVTLARFHPTKRFQLAAASIKGTVCVYDVQASRKLLQQTDSHTAPCRDLCMSPADSDTLISVGFDCLVNIFDMRSKVLSTRLHCNHPLSAVAVSECGTYFCVGNLKGELATFDIRNTADVLCIKQVHDQATARIAILPAYISRESGELRQSSRNHSTGDTLPPKQPAETAVSGFAGSRRDSFCDFLDFHTNKDLDKVTGRFMAHHESFNWDTLNTKTSDEASPGPSDKGKTNALGELFDDQSFQEQVDNSRNIGNVNTRPRRKSNDDLVHNILRRSSAAAQRLMLIYEEQTSSSPDSAQECVGNESSEMSGSENHRKSLPPEECTTVTSNGVPSPQTEGILKIPNGAPSPQIPTSSAPQSTPESAPIACSNADLMRAIADLRLEMQDGFTDLRLILDQQKFEMCMRTHMMHSEQLKLIEELRERTAPAVEPYLKEIKRLRREVKLLQAQLKIKQ